MGKPSGGDTTTQNVKLPPWMEKYAKNTLDFAHTVANQPYSPYPGQMVAGLDPYQKQAINYAAGQLGATGAAMQPFISGLQSFSGFQPQQVQAGQINLPPSYQPQQVDPRSMMVDTRGMQIDPTQASAAQLRNANLNPYMNPYTD